MHFALIGVYLAKANGHICVFLNKIFLLLKSIKLGFCIVDKFVKRRVIKEIRSFYGQVDHPPAPLPLPLIQTMVICVLKRSLQRKSHFNTTPRFLNSSLLMPQNGGIAEA